MLAIITRFPATDLPKILLVLWLLLSAPVMAITPGADANLKLVPVQPPTSLFNSTQPLTDSSQLLWYQLDLPPVSERDWLMIFGRVPARQLDVFIPTDSGYRLQKLGVDHTGSPATAIAISPGEATTWYLRHIATPLAPLQPQLLPSHLYADALNLQGVALGTVQTLLIIALIATLIARKKWAFRPLIGHVLTTIALVLMWQGDVFHLFSWPGDPAHWVLFMTTLVLVTGIASYRHLLLTDQARARQLILTLNILTLATMLYGLTAQVPLAMTATGTLLLASACLLILIGVKTRQPAAILLALITVALYLSGFSLTNLPSTQALLLLGLHAALLPLLCWTLYRRSRTAIDTTHINNNRRVFTNTLREHLHNPDAPLSVADLKQRILATVASVLPGAPTIILHYQENQWHTTPGDSAGKVTRKLNRRLPVIEADLLKVISADAQTNINFKDSDGTIYWLYPLSIATNDKVLLVLALPRHQRTADNWQTACDISSHASTVFQANRQSLFWQREASLDPLTGALNRRAFQREAEAVVHQCIDATKPCSLLFMDLDNFKQLNDCQGHNAGDKALKHTARLCRKALRQEDLLGRYGGEEFVVLLPNTEPWQAFQIAERIRKTVARKKNITVSIGIAALSDLNSSLDKLLAEADAAMYLAKQQGKNRTVTSASRLNISKEPV